MGFCYEGRKLVCDCCGASGSRKRKCPFGYCPALAVCKTCWASKFAKGAWKADHVKHGCDKKHAAYMAKEAEKAAMLAEGKVLRCAAMGVNDTVHVLFEGKDGNMVGFFMSSATYGSIPLGAHATPDDYLKFGSLTAAPSEF